MADLSPAAQAVMDAINKELDEAPWDVSFLAGVSAAAAIRSAANYVVPENLSEYQTYTNEAIRINLQGVRRKLLAIATELEQLND
jgi:hypothetical protein